MVEPDTGMVGHDPAEFPAGFLEFQHDVLDPVDLPQAKGPFLGMEACPAEFAGEVDLVGVVQISLLRQEGHLDGEVVGHLLPLGSFDGLSPGIGPGRIAQCLPVEKLGHDGLAPMVSVFLGNVAAPETVVQIHAELALAAVLVLLDHHPVDLRILEAPPEPVGRMVLVQDVSLDHLGQRKGFQGLGMIEISGMQIGQDPVEGIQMWRQEPVLLRGHLQNPSGRDQIGYPGLLGGMADLPG